VTFGKSYSLFLEFKVSITKGKGTQHKDFFISPGPFIGPVEIRGKKNKKKYISFLPPVYWGVEFRTKGLNFAPFRVSINLEIFILKYLIILSFTPRALVIFNFFTQMDDSALIRKKRWSKM